MSNLAPVPSSPEALARRRDEVLAEMKDLETARERVSQVFEMYDAVLVEYAALRMEAEQRLIEQQRIADMRAQEDARTIRRLWQERNLLQLERDIFAKDSRTDALTGVLNRRGLMQEYERVHGEALRLGRPVAALFIDLDKLKEINAQGQRRKGDLAIEFVGKTLQTETRRAGDVLGRYGGDEFVVLLPGASRVQAERFARQVRAVIETRGAALAARNDIRGITVSIGVAAWKPNPSIEAEFLLACANSAVAEAKAAGGNAVAAKPMPYAALESTTGGVLTERLEELVDRVEGRRDEVADREHERVARRQRASVARERPVQEVVPEPEPRQERAGEAEREIQSDLDIEMEMV